MSYVSVLEEHGHAGSLLADYGIPTAESAYYEIDRLVPLAIGGANIVTNLWSQPLAEGVQRNVLEFESQRRVCHHLTLQAEAQREIADDLTAAYVRYVGAAAKAYRSG